MLKTSPYISSVFQPSKLLQLDSFVQTLDMSKLRVAPKAADRDDLLFFVFPVTKVLGWALESLASI